MISMTKEYSFVAAHRIENHPKCGRMHGHNYKVVVTLGSPKKSRDPEEYGELDPRGFILDFADLNKVMEPLLELFDHRYMVSYANQQADCPYYRTALQHRPEDIFDLRIEQTSAELLAAWFKGAIQNGLVTKGYEHIAVLEVQVWETPKAYATS